MTIRDSERTPVAEISDSSLEDPDGLTPSEVEDLAAANAEVPPIVYSGQDFDVNGLVRRFRNDDILIPTFGHEDQRIVSAGFQRSFVWSKPQMDRFIESILLGYPIPGIFFVKQQDKRYLVLDGQQRLTTLKSFEEGQYKSRKFLLENVADQFKGLSYRTLPDELRRSFDDTFIQATIVTTDGSSDSLESIYQIFERLNSGGTQLTPHEIRVALFAGPLIDYIEEINRGAEWRMLYGNPSKRLRDQELVLRIIALYDSASEYRRPLKAFLNSFSTKHRQLESLAISKITSRFTRAASLIESGPGRSALRSRGRQVNAALTEALFVGLMRRLDRDEDVDPESVAGTAAALDDDEKLLAAISKSTADEEQLRTRLEIATASFERI